MNTVMTLGFFITILYLLIQFARQEHVQDEYEDTIGDIEGRLEWARTRRLIPFGMEAQLKITHERLDKAKRLWKENRWNQAYRVSLRSQEAMNKAQSIYSAAIRLRRK
jgi:hypothetical protein